MVHAALCHTLPKIYHLFINKTVENYFYGFCSLMKYLNSAHYLIFFKIPADLASSEAIQRR
jgi:hypothetical protein